jgi:hypothetical protein
MEHAIDGIRKIRYNQNFAVFDITSVGPEYELLLTKVLFSVDIFLRKNVSMIMN